MDERRCDDSTRSRIDVVAESWEAALEDWNRASTDLDRRSRRVAWLLTSSMVLMLMVVLVGGVALKQTINNRADRKANQAREIANKRSDQALHKISYRICQREAVDRAFAIARVGAMGGPPARRRLLDSLPILDCRPNLSGNNAFPMTVRQQLEFAKRFEQGKLSREEQGICTAQIHDPLIC
jgi:hypothetical protein